ncbi:phosphate acetyltransferase [Nitratireductor thuwali]|uniref:(R)-specific enoyl-CoA hydratase n=1 Tax=Nitratireductor thuwali TaxID=2267699 RepID=A0ABY5MHX9_9HYPH|nr:(R)-specific enoyl-CoA hydratase [Nitratireductor thuwali]
MEVGQSAEITRRYSRQDLEAFGALIDMTAAAPDTVPEPLIAALFSYLLGVRLPGPGTNYLKQEMRFLRSAPLDTDLTARVTISRFRADGHLVDLWATCETSDRNLVCEGRSLVLAKDVGA